jgi:hypothetical protein
VAQGTLRIEKREGQVQAAVDCGPEGVEPEVLEDSHR